MLTVRDLLNEKGAHVHAISPRATMLEALKRMAQHDVGGLLVIDDAENIVGLVTEREYARDVRLKGRFSTDLTVADVMSRPVYAVKPTTACEHCMALMTEKRTRYLPVVEEARLVGIISIGDVLKGLIRDKKFEIAQLEGYIFGVP